MMMKLTGFVLAGAFLAVISASARADLTPSGDPMSGNSWGQGFAYDAGGVPVDLFAVNLTLVDGGPFADPAVRAFAPADWQNVFSNGSMAFAQGGATSQLSFELWFDSPVDFAPVTMQFATFEPGSNSASEVFFVGWDGLEWTIGSGDWSLTRDEAMQTVHQPTPSAVTLGALGLGSVAMLVRRRR